MLMHENTRKLSEQLKDKLLDVSDGQLAAIITETQDEAIAEARAIIKAAMVQGILEYALDQWEGPNGSVVAEEEEADSGDETPSPTAEAVARAPEGEEQVQQEIEAIRQKIAQNEKFLNRGPGPLTKPQNAPVPPVEEEVSASRQTDEDGCGYYVYGIVGGNGSQPVQGLPEEGMDPAYPVYALPYQAIQAIVSTVPLEEFGQEPMETNVEDPEWVKTKVCVHDRVLETVVASNNVVPMRFCTIYQSEDRVREALTQYYDDFVDALAHLDGKQEWGVKLYCDGETLGHRVGGVSDKVKELKAQMAGKSSGRAYFVKRKMEKTIDEEKERLSDECAQRSHDHLASHAEEVIINPLQSKQATGRQEEMILNGAYLVADEKLADFQAELASLQEEYGELGFSYELTGPWPPYNFVPVIVSEGAADE